MYKRFLRCAYSLGLIPITVLGSLSSCNFINDDKTEPVRIDFPSFQEVYPDGAQNKYSVLVTAGTGTNLIGTLTMDWDNASINDPLNSNAPINVVKFTTTEDIPGLNTSTTTQYITQSAASNADAGSITLVAFYDGIGTPAADKNWIDIGGNFNNRETIQTLFSPFQPDSATAGEKGAVRPYDFKVTGNCTTNVSCQEIANVSGTFTVVDQPLRIVSTTLGDFEAYLVSYTINVPSSIIGAGLTSLIDFRTSCISGDTTQAVIVSGTMLINPRIGPVQISNACNSVSYTATLSNTTMSF